MKTFSKILTLALLTIASPAFSAGWGAGFGIGNPYDQSRFSGSGVNMAVVPSVRSNMLWYALSAAGSGVGTVDRICLKQDFLSGRVDFWIATNSWTCASNQPAGTNIIWLSGTNSGLATNDIIVLRTFADDGYQAVMVGGGTTDAGGLVYTNDSGNTGIKLWNTPTNPIVAGDKIYKMVAQTLALFPLQEEAVTNKLIKNPWGQCLSLNDVQAGEDFRWAQLIDGPALVTMTYSNAATLLVRGTYFPRRPQ